VGQTLSRRYKGASTAVTIKLGPTKAYVLLQPETFAPVLRDSKKCTNKLFSVLVMEMLVGTPKQYMRKKITFLHGRLVLCTSMMASTDDPLSRPH
jgi:hypothetical protein